jgi:hypothetical protein
MGFFDALKLKYGVEGGVNDKDYPYYRVSDNPANPSATEDNKRHDPYGVYLFIKKQYVDIEDWGGKRYRWDAKLKPGLKLLNFAKMPKSVGFAILKAAGFKTMTEIWNLHALKQGSRYDIPKEEVSHFFYPLNPSEDNPSEEQLQKIANKNISNNPNVYRIIRLVYPTKIKTNRNFSKIFQRLGYDGILDLDGAMMTLEPQLIVFNPKNVIWHQREENVIDGKIYRLPFSEYSLANIFIRQGIKESRVKKAIKNFMSFNRYLDDDDPQKDVEFWEKKKFEDFETFIEKNMHLTKKQVS